MRVGINCLRLNPSYAGGINTFTLGLLKGLSTISNGTRFHVFGTTGNESLFHSLRDAKNFDFTMIDNLAHRFRRQLCRAALLTSSDKAYEATCNQAFRSVRELIEHQVDVVYVPSTVLPYFNSEKPTVLSIHDIQHVHYPEFFSWPVRLSRRLTYGLSARHADFFQASSKFIKCDLQQSFGCITERQIEIIPEGVSREEFSRPINTKALKNRYRIPERFLFYPAQFWFHKNHMILLKALRQVEKTHGLEIPLVLTGGEYSAAPSIFRYLAEEKMHYVKYLGKVPFEDLVGLYQSATFLVMPSLHESNSLPVLEAAAAGTAIIASNIAPNEELSCTLQLHLFNPNDADELARLIYCLWHDQAGASAQAAHNRQQIAKYSWENTARGFGRLFERAANS